MINVTHDNNNRGAGDEIFFSVCSFGHGEVSAGDLRYILRYSNIHKKIDMVKFGIGRIVYIATCFYLSSGDL